MADIAMRFNRDMLVISSPLEPVLARQGYNVEDDLEFTGIVEPEAIRGALRLSQVAGAQCLVTNTAGITPARLVARRMDGREGEIAEAALRIVAELRPQHIFVEIGPCGLPLDTSSKASVKENCAQYVRAAQVFAGREFDAFFLNGFSAPGDLMCALEGIAQVSDAPLIASVEVDAQGVLADGRHTLEDALAIMLQHGAAVAGFATPAPLEQACAFARRACGLGSLPVLVQLGVNEVRPKQGEATAENPYYCPDTMIAAATQLRGAGAQFLRAVGAATPAYTGALVAASEGFNVMRKPVE